MNKRAKWLQGKSIPPPSCSTDSDSYNIMFGIGKQAKFSHVFFFSSFCHRFHPLCFASFSNVSLLHDFKNGQRPYCGYESLHRKYTPQQQQQQQCKDLVNCYSYLILCDVMKKQTKWQCIFVDRSYHTHKMLHKIRGFNLHGIGFRVNSG